MKIGELRRAINDSRGKEETFTPPQVALALRDFLSYGEESFERSGGHKGYFSGDGYAARCLRWHLRTLTEIEGRQPAPAEAPRDSLRPDEAADLHVQPRPAHVRNLSWAHKYYVRALELAGLVVKARGELKEARREAELLRVNLRTLDAETREAWASREKDTAGTIRQLKATIHLLTKGS